jgi:Fe(3+) dicitrate transport protein
MFGPQTVGGVVNYITPAPRQAFGGYVPFLKEEAIIS